MDVSVFIPMIVSWIVHRFPSLSEYAEYVGPALMAIITCVGLFTNFLPSPGHTFPVPDVAALELQLEGGGKFILKLAKFARTLVISINWFLATAVYEWFYNFMGRLSKFLPKLKKKTSVISK